MKEVNMCIKSMQKECINNYNIEQRIESRKETIKIVLLMVIGSLILTILNSII